MSAKRPRNEMYNGSVAERAAKTKEFIRSLCFSKPLSCLRDLTRLPCPKCNKKRMYFCYDCLAVCNPATHPAPLQLPIQVHVLLHPGELRGKSTSLAASTISPDIHISRYPSIPEGLSPSNTLVLYPSAESTTLDQIENLFDFKNVVFVDSTWQQSKAIARDERVTQFRHVRIQARESLFWRFQDKDPSYLATVEAIYYFLREFVTQKNKHDDKVANVASPTAAAGPAGGVESSSNFYNGEVDDLLYYYINQYILVQETYQPKGPAEEDVGEDESEPPLRSSSNVVSASSDAPQQQEEEKQKQLKQQAGALSHPGAIPIPAGGRRFTPRHFGGYVLDGVTWNDVLTKPAAAEGREEPK